MAHFAEIDSNNIVLRVVVIDNNDVNANGGDESLTAAKAVEKIVPFSSGVKWVQTSYNNNFRCRMAGIDYVYNEEFNVFIHPKPFPSWILNNTTWIWEAPISKPTTYINNPEGQNPPIEDLYDWDELTQSWIIGQ